MTEQKVLWMRRTKNKIEKTLDEPKKDEEAAIGRGQELPEAEEGGSDVEEISGSSEVTAGGGSA